MRQTPVSAPSRYRLKANSYGKSRVRLSRIIRHADRHDIREMTVAIKLLGAFEEAYTVGDNSRVVATDTMKNTVYALAAKTPPKDAESFGLLLARHFLDNNAHVTAAEIRIVDHPWVRIPVAGRPHPTAFVSAGSEVRTAALDVTRTSAAVRSGVDGLVVLKTTDSAFKGFLRDQYTTLPETDDRIFATSLTVDWLYRDGTAEFDADHELVRRTLLETFAGHKSLGVQQTLYDMGVAALAACGDLVEITLTAPNKHRIPFDLRPMGLENRNEVFVTTDEPHGLISATVTRG